MAFLNPALAWFAVGGAIPVIIHLLHRQRFQRVPWAAMEFLLAAIKKTQRRLRLENLLLLLLRILIMVILALAIARPFFEEAPIAALATSDTHTILVIDNSYSMGFKRAQKTNLDAAREAATGIIEKIKPTPEDRFDVILLSDYPDRMVTDSNNKESLLQSIKSIPLSNHGTSLPRTFALIEEVLKKSNKLQKDVYLITDLQRNGWEARSDADSARFQLLLKELSHRKDTRFLLVDVGTEGADNYAFVSLRVEGRPLVTTRRTTHLAADLYNFSPTPLSAKTVTLTIDDNFIEQREVSLEANALTPLRFQHDFHDSGPHRIRLRVESDFLSEDDERFLALDVRGALNGLIVDGEPGSQFESETIYYKFALDPFNDGLTFKLTDTTTELFNAEDLENYDFVVLANVVSLGEEKIAKLEQFVHSGGGLLIALGDRVDRHAYNSLMWREGTGLLPARIEEIAGDPDRQNVRRIAALKRDHPMFHVFAEKLTAAPFDLLFYQYFQLTPNPGAALVAQIDDAQRSPIFVESAFGDGKVFLMAAPLDAEWTEGWTGTNPYFVLMNDLSSYLGSRPGSRLNLNVGDAINLLLPMKLHAPDFDLLTPEGPYTVIPRTLERTDRWFLLQYPTLIERDAAAPRSAHDGLRTHGFYTIRKKSTADDDPPLAHIACNLSPTGTSAEELGACEGRLDRISWSELQQRYPDFKCSYIGPTPAGEVAAAALPASTLWKYLLSCLLVMMVAETTLAWLFGRAKQ